MYVRFVIYVLLTLTSEVLQSVSGLFLDLLVRLPDLRDMKQWIGNMKAFLLHFYLKSIFGNSNGFGTRAFPLLPESKIHSVSARVLILALTFICSVDF